jgi:glycerol-3-phosphate dehydrogenase
MRAQTEREAIWSQIAHPWDIFVIGGGITGAGILREATRLGLRCLLVEQHDFAWGTSSRSSKLVHGGLRYLKEGKIGLTRAAVAERERLLEEGPGLIDPLGFLLATYQGDHPGRRIYRAGLTLYDLMALQWTHRYFSAADFQMLAPHIATAGLRGGFQYGDAQTDDARLVLRVIQEAVAAGGTALNYVAATELLTDAAGQVIGSRLRDEVGPQQPRADRRTADVHARVVINATGAWADALRGQVGATPRVRPLRGSHLIFPARKLPVAQAISFLHPLDHRPVFIFPWEGVTLVGTTDVDHGDLDSAEPHIAPAEVGYLMAAVASEFPSLGLTLDDVTSTLAGIRPVIGTGEVDPSRESRDHVVWEESGLLTVTGGKLTTFRRIALDALRAARHRLPEMPKPDDTAPVLIPVDVALSPTLAPDQRRRLLGRYGAAAPKLVAAAQPGELEAIAGTPYLWAEVRWAARAEAVAHLDDLMLRRVRLGLLLPDGGAAILPRVQAICQEELGWDKVCWDAEQAAYFALVRRCYGLPERKAVPDWNALLVQAAEARNERRLHARRRRRRWARRSAVAGGVSATTVALAAWLWRRQRRHAKI